MTRAQAEALLRYVDAAISQSEDMHAMGRHDGSAGWASTSKKKATEAREAFLATVDDAEPPAPLPPRP